MEKLIENRIEIKTNSIREKIFQFVDESPGIRYRELLRIQDSRMLFYLILNFLENSVKVR